MPEIGGDIGHAANHLQHELQGQSLGPALEQWFYASHSSARSGALPIPPYIRQRLEGHIDPVTLDQARYKVGDNGFLNLAHDIEHLSDTKGVTLIDVIVFRGPSEANDICLWAHELTHVKQFREQGVRDFAIRYARSAASEEDEAYGVGNQCNAQGWAVDRIFGGGMGGPLPGSGFPPPPQPQIGAFCYTPLGRFGPGAPQPIGAPCNIATPEGLLFGQIGP